MRTRSRLRSVLAVAASALLLAPAATAQSRDEPAEPQPDVEYPSPEWFAREAANFARVSEAPAAQVADPLFQERWQTQSLANVQGFLERQLADPAWRTTGNLCETWGEQCTGDPFRYPGVDPFYDEAVVEQVAFLDRGGARLAATVWAPATGSDLPGVVITNGSVQAPQTLYWWAAQALVRSGYVVLTFDPRGQGRSDNATPDGEMGSNANSAVFATNTVDAVDFFRSTPERPYGPNGDDPRATTEFNPLWERIDRERLGLAGHSLGATGVSVVQGIEPWPGDEGDPDGGNPVDAIVAWDNLAFDEGGLAGFPLVPRVPAMGQTADYFLTPTPYTEPPDPDDKRRGFLLWQEAEVPTYELVIEGGSHYEWSLLPTFPTTAWEPGGDGGPTWRQRLSFYFRSSRDFPDRDGAPQVCEDIRIGCDPEVAAPDAEDPDPGPTATTAASPAPSAPAAAGPDATPAPGPVAATTAPTTQRGSLPATGGGLALGAVALAAATAVGRRRR